MQSCFWFQIIGGKVNIFIIINNKIIIYVLFWCIVLLYLSIIFIYITGYQYYSKISSREVALSFESYPKCTNYVNMLNKYRLHANLLIPFHIITYFCVP